MSSLSPSQHKALIEQLEDSQCSDAVEFIENWVETLQKKEYQYMPARRLATELLSEQHGWGIYTNTQNNRLNKEANMLVHLGCNRHFPNWWLAPDVLGGAANDPEIDCAGCKERLPLDVYHVFWGIYRLLNMKKSQ